MPDVNEDADFLLSDVNENADFCLPELDEILSSPCQSLIQSPSHSRSSNQFLERTSLSSSSRDQLEPTLLPLPP